MYLLAAAAARKFERQALFVCDILFIFIKQRLQFVQRWQGQRFTHDFAFAQGILEKFGLSNGTVEFLVVPHSDHKAHETPAQGTKNDVNGDQPPRSTLVLSQPATRTK